MCNGDVADEAMVAMLLMKRWWWCRWWSDDGDIADETMSVTE